METGSVIPLKEQNQNLQVARATLKSWLPSGLKHSEVIWSWRYRAGPRQETNRIKSVDLSAMKKCFQISMSYLARLQMPGLFPVLMNREDQDWEQDAICGAPEADERTSPTLRIHLARSAEFPGAAIAQAGNPRSAECWNVTWWNHVKSRVFLLKSVLLRQLFPRLFWLWPTKKRCLALENQQQLVGSFFCRPSTGVANTKEKVEAAGRKHCTTPTAATVKTNSLSLGNMARSERIQLRCDSVQFFFRLRLWGKLTSL